MRGEFQFDSPFWDPVTAEAKDLITQMLTLDPAQRPSAAALLSHPWLSMNHPGEVLSSTVDNLRRWTARRRLKSGIASVMALNRFKFRSSSSSSSSTKDKGRRSNSSTEDKGG
mmetsp:Transcript_12675/g.25022  ORF Transcript_12675/g.25022 Transcript_12675/m.25022 type:complete len:113 (-) Transcript_12675:74-412(-)